jgi:hypothetical protein
MKILIKTLVVLIFLTVLSAYITTLDTNYVVAPFMIIPVLKFNGVSFFFMDIRKAHVFWKIIIVLFLLFFSTTVLMIA